MPWPFGGGRWFPGTNLQDLNLDWIIRRVRDLSKGIIAPWINPNNQHWMVYDTATEEFIDSGVSAASGSEPVKPLAGKTIVILGDSLPRQYGNYVTEPLASTGLNVINISVGGSTISRATNLPVANQLANIPQGVTPDYIMIWAGGNDVSAVNDWGVPAFGNHADTADTATFPSLRSLLYNIRSQYPAAQIIGVIRNTFLPSVANYKRCNYIFGTLGLIYADWQVPVINLDGVSNMDVSLSQSAALYYDADLRHYSPYGYAACDKLFEGVILSGLNSHNVRHPNYIITGAANKNAAVTWFMENYIGGWSADISILQGGYNLLYDSTETAITLCGDGSMIAADDYNTTYTNALNIANRRDTRHVVFIEITSATPLTTMMNVPSGFLNGRIGSITANTAGMPADLASALGVTGWSLIGMWQENGYYRGLMWVQSNFSAASPVAGLQSLFRVRCDINNWYYQSIDGSVQFTAQA